MTPVAIPEGCPDPEFGLDRKKDYLFSMAKGMKTGGRKAHTPNKVTRALKDMILSALERVGDDDYLVKQAGDNPVAFISLLKATLPKDMNITGSVAVSLCDALKELPEK